ncbi:MAG TPA: ATP-binding protein [Candidatus Lustribacter sp.]|nr:ATP-binding protein [Candidatus Lustribacter sp.]
MPAWHLEIPDSTNALHQREQFVQYLEACGATGDYAAAELIFGEIVGNAMIHAPGPIAVSVEWTNGSATLRVSDAGPPIDTSHVRKFPDPLGEHGRGLPIVNELSGSSLSAAVYVDGKTISAELPVRLSTPRTQSQRLQ